MHDIRECTFGTLCFKILPTVYEPAEDSFLLATYASSLTRNDGGGAPSKRGLRILDAGTGSGIAALSAAKAKADNEVLGLDISHAAVECAKANAKANGISNCKFVESDLFSSIPKSKKFDAILFNPPYLPTTREERLSLEEENAAFDGGESGMGVFYKFSAEVSNYLVCDGKAAVIATSLNGGIEKTIAELNKRVGKANILAEEKFFFEKIALIEAVKK